MKGTFIAIAAIATAAATLPAMADSTAVRNPNASYGQTYDRAPDGTVYGSSGGSSVTSGRGSAGVTVREPSTSGMGAGTDANASMRSVPAVNAGDARRPSSSGMGAGTDANASMTTTPPTHSRPLR